MSPQATLDRRTLIISVLMIFLMVMLAGGMAVYVLSDPGIADATVMVRTAEALLDQYPEQFKPQEAFEDAQKEMFDQLDRYSGYMPKEAVNAMDEELSGGYAGIGITVVDHHDGLMVLSVKDGGPADKAGLLVGDIIVQADSVRLDTVMNSPRAAAHLRGPEGSQVDLRVWRAAVKDTIDITITRGRIDFEHVIYAGRLRDSVVYFRLTDFEAGASDELEAAIDSLIPDKPVTGIILDLRGNGGGLLNEGLNVAEQFLPPGSFIVGTKGRSRWDNREFYARDNDPADHLPMAVLVDRNTASAAEIVSGSLRYNDRAMLVGDTTFGKGLVQGHFLFLDGDGLRLTISRYYFEGGVFLNEFDSSLNEVGRGLVPDHYYATEDISPFLADLENSFLLLQFGSAHAEGIVASIHGAQLDPVWLDRFKDFCKSERFSYTSETTRDARLVKDIATLTKAPKKVFNKTQSIIDLSKQLDSEQFRTYSAYIARRLMEIAVQTTEGSHTAYREVVIPNDSLIDKTVDLLLHQQERVG